MTDRKRSNFLLQMALIFTVMIGVGIFSNADNLRWLFVDSTLYHQAPGEVLLSQLIARGHYGGLKFNVVYSYKVGNEEYISNRVHFGYQGSMDSSYAESYVEKYPVGKEVMAFYDEKNPEKSVLEPQIKWDGLLSFIS